jgi:hypothetical protein
VPVVPSELPAGVAPGIASIDPSSHELTRPGRAPVTVLPDSGWADTLLRVRGGYLVSVRTTFWKRVLVLVDDDGSQRVVRSGWRFDPSMVASDGRSFIAVYQRNHRRGVEAAYVIRRFRVQDGRAVGKALVRPYRGPFPRALTVTSTAVTLVSPHPVGKRGVEARTERWDTRTGRVRLISKNLNTAEDSETPRGWAASMTSHVVGVNHGLRQVALDSRTLKPLWRTRAGEALQQFSPDGRSVVTFSRRLYFGIGDGAFQKVSIRNARTGEVRADFTGYFAWSSFGLPSAEGFGWETSDSFVAYAYDDVVVAEEDVYPGAGGMVRCTVSTASCERIGDTQVVPMVRRSS